MTVINTNVKALVAQDSLSVNARKMSKAMEQLSTGLRVNSASDDAAGLAISSRMTSQIRGLDQAVRNANDAMSLLETAEGAMVEVSDIMQRMRELAVQSSSGTNSAADRAYLQLEFAALSDEIVRIRDTTEFNGMSLLNGDGNFTFQIGANASQTMSVAIDDIAAAAGGGTAITPTIAEPDGTNGQVSSIDFAAENTTREFEVGDKLFLKVGDANFTYTMTAEDVADFAAVADNNDDGVGDLLTTKLASMINTDPRTRGLVNASASVDGTSVLTITGIDLDNPYTMEASYSATVSIDPTTTASDGTNGQVSTIDFAAENTADEYAAGDIISLKIADVSISYTITAEDVADFAAAGDNNDDGVGDLLTTKLAALINTNASLEGVLNASATVDGTSVLTLTGIDLDNAFTLVASATGATATGIEGDISTQSGADSAIASLTTSLESLDSQRAVIGASINRLTHTVDNLTNISSNTAASRSRIIDTDYAKATSELARTQIIQQAATAMLAQANQQPASVLSLLQ
jgi:flagellin